MNNKMWVYGLVVLVLAGFCLAQGENLRKAGTTPDSAFYGLDKLGEKIHMAFTFGKLNKAELHLKFAEERLAEMDAMNKKNKTKHVEELADDEENELIEAEKDISDAAAHGKNVTDAAAHAANMTYKHILVLQALLDKVPEQARDAILHAINVSQRGHENALARMGGERNRYEEREREEQGEDNKTGNETRTRNETEEREWENETEKPENETHENENETEENDNHGNETPVNTTGGRGRLVMKITDKAGDLNITKLELAISSIRIHTSSGAVESKECTEMPYNEEFCEDETEVKENCTHYNVTQEVCRNETHINQTCTEEIPCDGGVMVNETCVNGTIIPAECTNTTLVVPVCETETEAKENCTHYNVTDEVCDDVILYNSTCKNAIGGETAGWATVTNQSKTFDLIKIKGVEELLGQVNLSAGRYTQIRLYISDASLYLSGVKQSLKVPSNTLKLIQPFTIGTNSTTTLLLDFDAEKSIHQAGDKYMLRPTVKITQE